MILLPLLFGFLLLGTFAWFAGCVVFLQEFLAAGGGLAALSLPGFMMILMGVTLPPFFVWFVAAFIYNSLFVRRLGMHQVYLIAGFNQLAEQLAGIGSLLHRDRVLGAAEKSLAGLNGTLTSLARQARLVSDVELLELWKGVRCGYEEALAHRLLKQIDREDLPAALKEPEAQKLMEQFCGRFEHVLPLFEGHDAPGLQDGGAFRALYGIFAAATERPAPPVPAPAPLPEASGDEEEAFPESDEETRERALEEAEEEGLPDEEEEKEEAEEAPSSLLSDLRAPRILQIPGLNVPAEEETPLEVPAAASGAEKEPEDGADDEEETLFDWNKHRNDFLSRYLEEVEPEDKESKKGPKK